MLFRTDKYSFRIIEKVRPKKEIWPDAYQWFETRGAAAQSIVERHKKTVANLERQLRNENARFKAFCKKETISTFTKEVTKP